MFEKNTNDMLSNHEIWYIYVILCLYFVIKLLTFYKPKGREIFNQLIQNTYKIQFLYIFHIFIFLWFEILEKTKHKVEH